MYYNYHATAKQLIADGHLIKTEIVEKWNSISPALVLYFDNHRPMPIRQYRWDEYLQFTNATGQEAPSSKRSVGRGRMPDLAA